MDTFVTTQKAAERLGVSDSRIRQLILNGKLAAVKAGRDWLIRDADLKLMEKRKTKPGPAAKAVSTAASKRAASTKAIKGRRTGQ